MNSLPSISIFSGADNNSSNSSLVVQRITMPNRNTAKYLIYPVFEGDPVELKELDRMSRVALSSRKDLIVATVDRLSKPIYYSVNKFEIINKVKLDEGEYGR